MKSNEIGIWGYGGHVSSGAGRYLFSQRSPGLVHNFTLFISSVVKVVAVDKTNTIIVLLHYGKWLDTAPLSSVGNISEAKFSRRELTDGVYLSGKYRDNEREIQIGQLSTAVFGC